MKSLMPTRTALSFWFHLNDRQNETFFISEEHPYVAEQRRQKEEGERFRKSGDLTWSRLLDALTYLNSACPSAIITLPTLRTTSDALIAIALGQSLVLVARRM